MTSFGSLRSTNHLLLIRAMIYQTTMRLLKNLAPWKNLMNFLLSQKNAVSQSLWILLSITVLTSTSGLKRHSQTQTVSMLTISSSVKAKTAIRQAIIAHILAAAAGNQFQTATNIIYICLQKSSLI